MRKLIFIIALFISTNCFSQQLVSGYISYPETGETLGAEKVLNGDFPTDLTSWGGAVAPYAVWNSAYGGSLTLARTAAPDAMVYQDVGLLAETTYRLTFEIKEITVETDQVQYNLGGTWIDMPDITLGIKTIDYTTEVGGSGYAYFKNKTSDANSKVVLDDISIKEIL